MPYFNPIAGSYFLVGAIALLLLALLTVVGPGRGRLGGWRRAALVAIRAVVILVLVLILLRPHQTITRMEKQSATLAVLIDQSRSMSVPDGPDGESRWQTLRRALADAAPALEELAGEVELKVYTFAAETHPLDVEHGKLPLPEDPDGKQTAIGAALQWVLQQEAGKRLLAVALLSDGTQRAYAPRDLPPQTAAMQMKHLGCPLFTFAFGKSAALGEARDVAVKSLLAAQNVFVKNELTVTGGVRVDGYVHRRLPVKLLFETSPGKMETVAQETLDVTTDGQLLPVRLSYAPQVPGEYKLTLEVPGQPGELVTTNNRLSTFVNVLRGGLNVLYLEGVPRVEARFISKSLDASPDINVRYVRIDPRDPATRPGDMAECFKPGKYEVYIIGDLDSTAFRGDELKDLADAVQRGAGLIMLGGLSSFGPGGYDKTPLADVLPVEMDRLERQNLDEPIRSDLHVPGPLKMRPTPLGLLHFATSLAGNRQQNLAAWSKLPPLEGANRFRGLAPGALPLAATGNTPLLVAQQYGGGRVLAFAGDSTWRWWMHGHQQAHKRFWRQVVLWLARKDQSLEGNVWVKLPRRRFAPLQRVEFVAGARSPAGEPLPDAQYKAEAVLPDGTRRPLQLVRQGEQMAGSLRGVKVAGDYAIEVAASHKGSAVGSARARFLVFEQDLELDNASADSHSLASLAAMTGGKLLRAEDLPELLESLAQKTESLMVPHETAVTYWDKWWVLLLFVGLLGAEWYLRKRWGLV